MFNLFRKKEKNTNSDLNNSSFANSLTIEQKSAIISTLIITAKFDDGNMNAQEIKSIEDSANELGISPQEFDPFISKLQTMAKPELINMLNTLNKEQKEWLLKALYKLIYADREIVNAELNLMIGLSKDLGFSEEENVAIAKEWRKNN